MSARDVTWARQAEILRAAEKDQQHIESNRRDLLEGLCGLLGLRNVMPYHQRISTASSLAYYVLTTLLDLQTLGEQFVHIVRCTPEGRPVPFLQRLLLLAEHIPWKPRDDELRNLVSVATKLHLVHFYLFGEYASIGRRLARSRYALFRRFLDVPHLSWIFKAIAYMSIARMVSDVLAKAAQNNAVNKKNGEAAAAAGHRSALTCAMCKDFAVNCTLTPCGHVFCWDCIANWAWTNKRCGTCRASLEPEKLVRVLNR